MRKDRFYLSVGELREVLSKLPDDAAVIISTETWQGTITTDDVRAIYSAKDSVYLCNETGGSGLRIWCKEE